MSKILFVVAEKQEAEPIIRHYNLCNKLEHFDVYSNNDDSLRLIITGAGVMSVIDALSWATLRGYLDDDTYIINVGFAGSNSYNPYDVVEISKSYNMNRPQIAGTGEHEYIKLLDYGVPCYTNNDFVVKTTIGEPVVFDMELAYICRFMSKAVFAIKVVSDRLSYSKFKNFNAFDNTMWKKIFHKIDIILNKLCTTAQNSDIIIS